MCPGVFILFTPTSCSGTVFIGAAIQQACAVARTKCVGCRCAQHMLWPHRELLMFEAANDCFPLTPTNRWIISKILSRLVICHCFGSSVRSHDAVLVSEGGAWGLPRVHLFAARDPRLLSDGAENKHDAMSVVAHQYLFNLHINTLGFGGSHSLMNASLPPSRFHVNSTAMRVLGSGKAEHYTAEESASSSPSSVDVVKTGLDEVDFVFLAAGASIEREAKK